MTTDLADLMERATVTMPVDTRRLVDGGLGRGAADVRRRRVRRAVGATGLVVVAALAVARPTPGDRAARDVQPAGPSRTTLVLLPTDELVERFADQLPGSSTPVEAQGSEARTSVRILRQLTNADATRGLVRLDASVSAPYDARGIAENRAFCREMHEKVGPRDGSDCVVVPGGIVQFWDDTVAPEDPTGHAEGIRMAYAYLMRWDGRNVRLESLNSTSGDVPPAPGAVPVIRTADVVALVQRLDLFEPPPQK